VDSADSILFKNRASVHKLTMGQVSGLSPGGPMPARRRKFFQQIGGTIQDLLNNLDYGGHFELVRLIRLWPEIVGETIARRTEVTSLKFHTALVRVSTAMWIQELNLMRSQIHSRINAAMRNDAVREIRFVHGRLSRRERKNLRIIGRPARRPIQLPELQDPELRAAFERLIEAWGRSPL
jgi:predicted nucleic acid-binding Zn ribbon protein